jgi:hypothetical protein
LAKRKSVSASVRKTLTNKAKAKKGVTTRILEQVYRRGQGAFLTAGSRPGVGMQQWAMARVNSFMRGSRKHDLDLQARVRKNRKR